jgi:ABC-2 type transport system ATP-binding protein
VTIFLTTHRLEEAERLCDRVAILNTTLRTIGRPAELRDRLFGTSLTVRIRAPLADPDGVLSGVAGVTAWRQNDHAGYTLAVADRTWSPRLTRALVAAAPMYWRSARRTTRSRTSTSS